EQGPKRTRRRGIERAATSRQAPHEAHLTEHPEVPRYLRLRHRDDADDRPHRLLSGQQHIEDRATVDVTDGVEDVRRGRRACHGSNISLYGYVSTRRMAKRDRWLPAQRQMRTPRPASSRRDFA